MSYLLSQASKVPQKLTVWSLIKDQRDAFGSALYADPEVIEGVWQDIDTVLTTPTSKERIDESFVHSYVELEVGSKIVTGEYTSNVPPGSAKEITRVREMRFIHARTTTYRYSL